ncbi:hypothetical protein V8E52_004362 [Russula decolorans]
MDPTTPPNATLQLPQSTPIRINTSTTLPFTTTQKYRIESCSAMADEMKKYIVGPMPAKLFLDDFLPTKDIPGYQRREFHPGCYDDAVNAEYEPYAYEPFNATSRQYIHDLKFVNSSAFNDCNTRCGFPFKIKPDVSVYPPTTDDNVTTNSALVEIIIEFKWHPRDDPFGDVHGLDPNRPFIRDTKAAHDTLGQITSYAAAQLGAQFRTHIFSIYCTIAPPAMRGIDESVSDPSLTEKVAAREALQLDETVPLVKLSVPNADGVRFFVTSAPEATLYTPPGRATRGFKAYDILQQTMVYLKDSWRIDLPDIQAEGQVYVILRDAGTQHVPHCLASGDILSEDYHATKTQTYATKPWAYYSATRYIPHWHYRLCLDVVGHILVDYGSTYEMVSAVRDALIAHRDAYNAGILHRDFSPSNVIIDSFGNGWLIDWDLSKPGTWQFMSAKLIYDPGALHNFRDDLESLLYVVLWTTLIYSEVSNKSQVMPFVTSVLDPQSYENSGGTTKEDFLKAQSFLLHVNFPNCLALHQLIRNLADLFREESNQLRLASHESQNTYVQNAYETHYCTRYDQSMLKLQDHAATIELFETALRYRSEWPDNDPSVKQIFQPKSPTDLVRKTDWRSTTYCAEVRHRE